RFEQLGPDRYEMSEDEISMVGSRSGDTISLGDRMLVTIDDVAILRRTVYARRVVPEAVLNHFDGDGPPHSQRKGDGRPGRSRFAKGGAFGGAGRPGRGGGPGRSERPGRGGSPQRDARPGRGGSAQHNERSGRGGSSDRPDQAIQAPKARGG